MNAPTATPAETSATPARPRRYTAAFRCYPGSSRSRIQGLLGQHFPPLWADIEAKWLPSARPIAPSQIEATGDYARATLADVLIGFGEAGIEWDGFAVCHRLQETFGWQCDFHLCALIHAWSRGLTDKLRS